MRPTVEAFLRSWPYDPWLVAGLLLTAGIYLRGWLVMRRRDPQRWQWSQPTAFGGGLAVIFLALASPIEPFAALLLQVHMLQHLLLMMVAPPLLWLGAPYFPLLRGLPPTLRVHGVAPFLGARALRRVFQRLTHPVTAWLLFVAATWLWHVPPLYEAALGSNAWHYLQHVCFLGTALLFWYPVVRPYPSRPRWSLWFLPPYLLLADVQNTALSALFSFSDQPLYAYYEQLPRINGISALEDQATAGVLMWVPGSVAYLVPLFAIGIGLLYGKGPGLRAQGSEAGRQAKPSFPRGAWERGEGRVALLLVSSSLTPQLSPLTPIRRFLKWRHVRLALQIPLLLVAGLLIYDGLRGPQVTPMNLAGVLPWIHWRGLVILGLLSAGNVFCMACPFMLPRTVARRWLPQGRVWPRLLQSKWIAVILLVFFLWAYEAFALWDSPWWTAWIVVGYFVTAFVIDGFFRGAAFCKYVCPIGQFNFVQSLVSPLEIKVRDPAVCAACQTKDCIRGNEHARGCELGLYLPRKASNMDCTFCLDCLRACPHDNIALQAVAPGAELWHDPQRSGIGRFGRRVDLSALVLVLVFGAFANAAGMVGPVLEWEKEVSSLVGASSPMVVTTACYLLALIVSPALLVGAVAAVSHWWGGLPGRWLHVMTRYSFALVPLGFGMWLSHYSFHFLASYDTIVPAVQRFTGDLGWSLFGLPSGACGCCRPVENWLLRLEIIFLDLGLLLSLYSGYRIVQTEPVSWGRMLKAYAPWAILMLLLFAIGIWIVFQPMEMRGMMPG